MAGPAARREPTPLEAALERVGDRWSLLLVEALLDGPRRFNELAEPSPGIAPNILTDRLRRLERERIVVATPYQQRPPRMSYALTADGHDLASALRLLADWGARGAADADPIRHGRAGRRSRRAGTARPARSPSTIPTPDETRDRLSGRCGAEPARIHSRAMDDERWEPGMPVLDRQAVAPATERRPTDDAAAEPPGPAAALGAGGRPDAAPAPLHQLLSVIVLICGAIAITALELGVAARQPAGQAVRPGRRAAPRPDDRRRGRPDLALGLGVDAGRSRQGPVPAGLGRRQRHRPRRAGRRRARRPAGMVSRVDPGDATSSRAAPTAAPTDIASGGGVPPWLAASLNFCSRCGAPLPFGDDRRARTATGWPARPAATSPTSTRGWSSRPSRSPTTGEIVLIRRGIEPGHGLVGPAGRLPRGRRDGQPGGRSARLGGDRAHRRAGRDRRALHAARGGGRDDRVRGARSSAATAAPTPEATEIVAYPPEAIPWAGDRVQDDAWPSATGCAARHGRRPGTLERAADQLRSMKTFFVSV